MEPYVLLGSRCVERELYDPEHHLRRLFIQHPSIEEVNARRGARVEELLVCGDVEQALRSSSGYNTGGATEPLDWKLRSRRHKLAAAMRAEAKEEALNARRPPLLARLAKGVERGAKAAALGLLRLGAAVTRHGAEA
eukprot:3290400-Prymnesium_polylepis.1